MSDCLNVCDRSNVVVVRPTPLARRLGARPVWLGGVLDDATLSGVVEWVTAGGPGLAAPPDRIDGLRFAAPRWGRSSDAPDVRLPGQRSLVGIRFGKLPAGPVA